MAFRGQDTVLCKCIVMIYIKHKFYQRDFCLYYKSIQYLFTKTFSSSSYSLFLNIPPFFIITRSEVMLSSSQTHSTRTNPSSREMSSPCFSICEAQPPVSARRLDRISDVPAEVQQELGQLELEVEYADHVVSVVAEIEILVDISAERFLPLILLFIQASQRSKFLYPP